MSNKKNLLGVEKSMSNEEYWKARAELKEKLLEKNTDKIEKEVLKIFKEARKEILNELKILYSDIEATEYKKYETENLLKNLNKVIDNLYKENEKEITEGLKDIYTTMEKEAKVDLGVSFNDIDENLIREVRKTNVGTKLNENRDVFVTHGEVLEKIVDDLIESNWSGLTLLERI